jgi:hypothetical protein
MDLLVGPSSPLTKPARSQKRQMVRILADQHMGERGFGRQAARDEPRWCRSLCNAIGA